MNTNINDAMKPIFDRLDLDPVEFKYYEQSSKFISNPFHYTEDEQYNIVIEVVNNIGTIFLGTSDGVKFTEIELLGRIKFDGNNWVLL